MILIAMLVGGAIGALAGASVYGIKTWLRGERFTWKAAAAAATGGLVGGALFPPIMAGLAAVGLPAAAAYALAGGVAWGGLWSLAQDAAGWALGVRRGLAPASDYLVATALGVVVSAALLPLASRALGPGGLRLHAGTVDGYVLPSRANLVGNVAKAEGEFLAYGAASEAAHVGLRAAARSAPSLLPRLAPRRLDRDTLPLTTSPPADPELPAMDSPAAGRAPTPATTPGIRGVLGSLGDDR